MPEQSQLEKDIAALRFHVIDGIEDLKSSIDNIAADIQRTNKLLRQFLIVVAVILCLIAVHLIRHW